MAATTGGKARLFDLMTSVAELVRDGHRDEKRVADWIQKVKDDPEFDRASVSKIAAAPFDYDKTKDGWTLLEDLPRRDLTVSRLELVSFLKKGEDRINGEVMKKRAEETDSNFSQHDAEFLLKNQKDIPKKFRDFYLVFPGTVWQNPRGDRHVACLYWDGARWYLNFDWLDSGWRSSSRLLCFSK